MQSLVNSKFEENLMIATNVKILQSIVEKLLVQDTEKALQTQEAPQNENLICIFFFLDFTFN